MKDCIILLLLAVCSSIATPVQRTHSKVLGAPLTTEASFRKSSSVKHDLAVSNGVSERSSSMRADVAALVQGSNAKTWLRSNNSGLEVACDTHIKMHPDEILCPANCPFVRAEPTRLCQFKCVPASHCNADNPLANYANPETKRCETCKVTGCFQCGADRHVCAKCQSGYELVGDICLSQYREEWRVVFFIVGVGGCVVVYWIFALFFLRKEENPRALQAGLLYRQLSSNRNVAQDRPWYLWSNLQTRLINNSYGVMLHFRWQFAILVWSVFGTILFGLVALGFSFHKKVGLAEPNTKKGYDRCEEEVSLQEKAFNSMEVVYFFCVLLMYLVTFIGSLWFAYRQRRFYIEKDVTETTIRDFTVYVEGFPKRFGSHRLEQQYLDFFKSAPQFGGVEPVGVSICWDFRSREDAVEEALVQEFDTLGSAEDKAYKEATETATEARDEKDRSCMSGIDPQLKCLDAALGIGNFPCVKEYDEERPEFEDLKVMLKAMPSSGNLYLVFKTTADANKVEEACRKEPLKYKHPTTGREYPLTMAFTECEPGSVIWNGFGTERSWFLFSLVLGCVAVFLGVILLDVFFYAPYVIYILSYAEQGGLSQASFLSGFLLGMLIVGCNQVIYILIGLVADKCGWTSLDSKDCFYCVKYTLAVFFNTCIDLGTVLIMAQGYSVEMAQKMQIAADSTMSPKAVAESPDMQRALYVKLVEYIFPSCTLIPFLIEPVGTAVLPFFVARALIRSRKEVTIQDAERCLLKPPFDLSRYGDILVNMMLVCMTMVFTYTEIWQLYVFLIISVCVIYSWDQVRFLRCTCRTVFSGGHMDKAAQYMMAMPTAILGCCCVFKAYGASHQGFLTDAMKQFKGEIGVEPDRYNIFMYLGAAFWGHMILHWLLLKHVVYPAAEDEATEQDYEKEPPYEKVGAEKAASFFNTNPVHCLRSKYIYKHDPPCVFYRIGKEFLIKENKAIGIYFTGKEHVETPREEEEEEDNADIAEATMDHAASLAKKKASQAQKGFSDWADGA